MSQALMQSLVQLCRDLADPRYSTDTERVPEWLHCRN